MESIYDVVVIGGSYAGLQAALTLGRALRKVLVIDSGMPCNRQTPHSHNFLTQDGETPAGIAAKARLQLSAYHTVSVLNDYVVNTVTDQGAFMVKTASGMELTARKLLFTTGLKDLMPAIKGFEACWGVSVIHCPYCHGYEVHHRRTGILANGDTGYEFAKLISNWTKELTLYTNGESTLTLQQEQKLISCGINVVCKQLEEIVHEQGQINSIHFTDGSEEPLAALYARVPFEQHCLLPEKMGCELNEHGLIKVDGFGKTTVQGVYAAGDNSTLMRSVATAVATGMAAGALLNKELIDEDFINR